MVYCEIICQQHGGQKQHGHSRTGGNNHDNDTAAGRASSHSTPSPVMPKQLTPLTPASTRKNRNKHSRSPSGDRHNKPLSMRTNRPREIWVRSPSPDVGTPRRAANRRSPSPGVGSQGQMPEVKGQRSNNDDGEKGSVVYSKRSSSLSSNRRRTTADQQPSVI